MLALCLLATSVIAGPVPVLTYHNDISRTGANLSETALTTTNVNVNGFGKLFTRVVDDELYAQLLYVPAVNVPGRGTHNIVYAATVNNSVYAFDADFPDESAPLWLRNFIGSNQVSQTVSGVGLIVTVITQPDGVAHVVRHEREKRRTKAARAALASGARNAASVDEPSSGTP